MASEEMQGWHETNGQKLRVFSIILGEGRIWNNLDKASIKHQPKTRSFLQSVQRNIAYNRILSMFITASYLQRQFSLQNQIPVPVITHINKIRHSEYNTTSILLLALLPTVGFSLLSDSLLFCSIFTLLSPPSYSHYLHIFFDIYNSSLPWSPSNSRTYGFTL